MITNNTRHITTNEIYFFISIILSLSEVFAVFNILFLHANINFLERHFPHEQFLISEYSSILQSLLHSESYVLGFRI